MDDRKILHDTPLLLARGYRRYLNARGQHGGTRDRHDAAYFLFEIYLKYSAAITLHFAELWHVKPAARVFDVLLEGKALLERYDAVEKAGPAAADRQLLRGVRVEDGLLDLEFLPREDSPSIAGIEIEAER